jgi:hypothetical protein
VTRDNIALILYLWKMRLQTVHVWSDKWQYYTDFISVKTEIAKCPRMEFYI